MALTIFLTLTIQSNSLCNYVTSTSLFNYLKISFELNSYTKNIAHLISKSTFFITHFQKFNNIQKWFKQYLQSFLLTLVQFEFQKLIRSQFFKVL